MVRHRSLYGGWVRGQECIQPDLRLRSPRLWTTRRISRPGASLRSC